jgi:hypothetical protein|uniref:Uncharacterized protein n=1 Tax=Zea mays TaxID=4577 RepID=A0A804PZN5_MAIZE
MIVPNIRVTRLSSTRLRAFLGTQDTTFRHAARALRLADQRAVRGGDGSSVSVSGSADSRIPGDTAFHLLISSGGLFCDDPFAAESGESLDGKLEEAAADDRRRCRRSDNVVAGMRERGRTRGTPGCRQVRPGRVGLGCLGRNIRSPEEKIPKGGDARSDESAGQASRRRVSGPQKTRILFGASKCYDLK